LKSCSKALELMLMFPIVPCNVYILPDPD
jgi:hypothetical protein